MVEENVVAHVFLAIDRASHVRQTHPYEGTDLFKFRQVSLGVASLLLLACSDDGGDDQGVGGNMNSGGSSVGGYSAVGAAGGSSEAFGGSGPVRGGGPSTYGGTSGTGGQSSGAGVAGKPAVGGSSGSSTYDVSVQISGLCAQGLVLQLNDASDFTPSKDGTFSFPTALNEGAKYAVSIRSQPAVPTQDCIVLNGSGTIQGSSVSNVLVKCRQYARYHLVVDRVDNSVSTYAIEEASGRSVYVAKVTSGISMPTSVAVHPSGLYAYVANSGNGTISQYQIGADGTLAAPDPAAVSTGVGASALAATESGRFVFALSDVAGTVSQYSIANGLLKPLPNASVPAGAKPVAIALDPSDKFAYVANSGNSTITQYRISADGLSSVAAISVGVSPTALALHPTLNVAYVVSGEAGTVSEFSVDANTGTLLTPAISTAGTGVKPAAIAMHPLGRYAYVANSGDSTISRYSVADDGTLSPLGTVPTEAGPSKIAIDSLGTLAFVTSTTDGSIAQFAINASGELTPIAPRRAPAQASPVDAAVVGGCGYVKSFGRFAYLAGGNDTLSSYKVDENGQLKSIGMISAPGTGPSAIALDPSMHFAYVANSSSNTVSQYVIGAAGELTALSQATVGAGVSPSSIAFEPAGRYAYVVSRSDHKILLYRLGSDGVLSPLTAQPSITVETTGETNAIVVDPSGRFAYVSVSDGNVAQLRIGADGTLKPLSPAAIRSGTNPSSLTISPSGKHLYVVNSSGASISQFVIGSDGSLSNLATDPIAAGAFPVSIAMTRDGKYAYAANYGDANVSQYSVTDGALTPLTSEATVPAGVKGTDNPYFVATDPSGVYVYVVDNMKVAGAIWQYAVNGTGGLRPLSVPSVEAQSYARFLAIAGGRK